MKKEKNEKVKSGLGEFWDNWIEEDEQCKERIKKLIEEKKQEANKRNNPKEE